MKKLIIILTIFTLFQFTGCKTFFTEEGKLYSQSKSMVRQKRYDLAISNLSMSIQIDPEYKKAILYIEEIFPESQEYYKRELRNLAEDNTLVVLDRKASIYTSLNNINRSMRNLPQLIQPKTKAVLTFKLEDYSNELETSILAAAEGHYQEGLRLYRDRSRENAKASSKEFLKVLEYIPNYKDAVSLEAKARTDAIQSVVFLPFRGDNYPAATLKINEYILDIIVSNITSDQEVMEYTNIVDHSLLKPILQTQQLALSGLFDESTSVEIGKLVSANLIFTGKTNKISFKKPSITHRKDHREAMVPAVFDDLGREPLENEKITVEADIDLYRNNTEVKIFISFKLIDIETSTVLLSDSLLKTNSDTVFWADYEGDKRALSQDDLNMVNNKTRNVKDVEELLIEALRDLGLEVAGKLKNYLK